MLHRRTRASRSKLPWPVALATVLWLTISHALWSHCSLSTAQRSFLDDQHAAHNARIAQRAASVLRKAPPRDLSRMKPHERTAAQTHAALDDRIDQLLGVASPPAAPRRPGPTMLPPAATTAVPRAFAAAPPSASRLGGTAPEAPWKPSGAARATTTNPLHSTAFGPTYPPSAGPSSYQRGEPRTGLASPSVGTANRLQISRETWQDI